MSNIVKCGKTLSRWFLKVSNDMYGDVPPTPDDIQTEPDKVKLFFDSLFLKKTGLMHKKRLKRVISASVMRFN